MLPPNGSIGKPPGPRTSGFFTRVKNGSPVAGAHGLLGTGPLLIQLMPPSSEKTIASAR
jgi:hypothetical protein